MAEVTFQIRPDRTREAWPARNIKQSRSSAAGAGVKDRRAFSRSELVSDMDMQPFSQGFQAGRVPAMGGAGGTFRDLGDFLECQTAPQMKSDGFPFFRGQISQGGRSGFSVQPRA